MHTRHSALPLQLSSPDHHFGNRPLRAAPPLASRARQQPAHPCSGREPPSRLCVCLQRLNSAHSCLGLGTWHEGAWKLPGPGSPTWRACRAERHIRLRSSTDDALLGLALACNSRSMAGAGLLKCAHTRGRARAQPERGRSDRSGQPLTRAQHAERARRESPLLPPQALSGRAAAARHSSPAGSDLCSVAAHSNAQRHACNTVVPCARPSEPAHLASDCDTACSVN